METLNPQPPEKAFSKIKEKVKRFGRGISKKLFGEPKTPKVNYDPAQYAEFIEQEKRPHTLQTILNHEQKKRGLVAPEFEAKGASGFYATNEKLDPTAMHKIKNSPESPNGYIVGAGVSSLLTCLEMFKDNQDPKGMVFINIDPNALNGLNEFVENLKRGKVVYDRGSGNVQEISPDNFKGQDVFKNGESIIDSYSMILKNADRLIRLAKEGKIGVIQQSIFEPKVLDIVKNLEGFNNSRNVLYLSNIGDWVRRDAVWGENGLAAQDFEHIRTHNGEGLPTEYRRSFWKEKFAVFDNLKGLFINTKDKNYVVDTTDMRPVNYKLRVSTEVPTAGNYISDPSYVDAPTQPIF